MSKKYNTDEERRLGNLKRAKERYERIKADPILYEQYLKDDRERRQARKLGLPPPKGWKKYSSKEEARAGARQLEKERLARKRQNPEEWAKYRQRQRTSHNHHKEQYLQTAKIKHKQLRQKALAGYGSKCNCCKEVRYSMLDFDHVNNDGSKQRKELCVGDPFCRWIIDNNFPDTIQVLCANCNQSKARNGGVCEHKTEINL